MLMYMHYNHCHRTTAYLQLNILLLLLLLLVVVVVVVVVVDLHDTFLYHSEHNTTQ